MSEERVTRGKLAVFSCTHGNVPALEAVLDDIKDRGIKLAIHLGDSVGYGPEPEETVALLEDRKLRSIQGCWDKSVANEDDDCGCDFLSEEESARGKELFAWTLERTSEATRKHLGDLPDKVRLKAPCGILMFVHGSPRSPNEYLHKDVDPVVLLERTHTAKCDYLICGHTHVPFIHKVAGAVTVEQPHPHTDKTDLTQFIVQPKYVLNAGSVGEPLHGPEATYIALDLDSGQSEIIYVPYDVQETIRRMEKADVPAFAIERFRQHDEITRKNRACMC